MTDRIPKVLVVDDEEELANFLAKAIAKKDILSRACYGGLEAVDFLKVEKVDVVLTDMRMPRMGGVELIDWIREHIKPSPAIFVLTGYADENHKTLADLQLDGIFQKPSDMKAVVEAVIKSALKTK